MRAAPPMRRFGSALEHGVGADRDALARFGVDFQQSEFELYSERRGERGFAGGPVMVKWKKGHPHGGPPGQLKKIGAPPPFPGLPFEGEDGPKGGKHKKGKGKKK